MAPGVLRHRTGRWRLPLPRSRYGRLLKRTRWHFDLLRDLVERVEWQHRRG
ncbi:hypothetical protein [Delftia lacustris]|uniref:hypothetical protein n=1 Tax=Delftia lacustris TaxID=558537 RepID=UPI001EF095A9|nr:hypothetical protein [Delftia lacustris]